MKFDTNKPKLPLSYLYNALDVAMIGISIAGLALLPDLALIYLLARIFIPIAFPDFSMRMRDYLSSIGRFAIHPRIMTSSGLIVGAVFGLYLVSLTLSVAAATMALNFTNLTALGVASLFYFTAPIIIGGVGMAMLSTLVGTIYEATTNFFRIDSPLQSIQKNYNDDYDTSPETPSSPDNTPSASDTYSYRETPETNEQEKPPSYSDSARSFRLPKPMHNNTIKPSAPAYSSFNTSTQSAFGGFSPFPPAFIPSVSSSSNNYYNVNNTYYNSGLNSPSQASQVPMPTPKFANPNGTPFNYHHSRPAHNPTAQSAPVMTPTAPAYIAPTSKVESVRSQASSLIADVSGLWSKPTSSTPLNDRNQTVSSQSKSLIADVSSSLWSKPASSTPLNDSNQTVSSQSKNLIADVWGWGKK